MITLYAFKTIFEGGVGETKDLRAQWALEETGLPYRVHALDQLAGDLQSDAYGKISPFHQVPSIASRAGGPGRSLSFQRVTATERRRRALTDSRQARRPVDRRARPRRFEGGW
jgi:hypothetical protein